LWLARAETEYKRQNKHCHSFINKPASASIEHSKIPLKEVEGMVESTAREGFEGSDVVHLASISYHVGQNSSNRSDLGSAFSNKDLEQMDFRQKYWHLGPTGRTYEVPEAALVHKMTPGAVLGPDSKDPQVCSAVVTQGLEPTRSGRRG
jgi:hypothetical protein